MAKYIAAKYIASPNWFVGSNGNRFFDWGGFRYSVIYLGRNRYQPRRNGEAIAMNDFQSHHEAQAFVEEHSGYRGRKVSS